MKTILGLIKVVIIFLFITGAFFLLINKTFIYDKFKGELMEGDGIPLKRFMYLTSDLDSLNLNFKTVLSKDYLEQAKNSYLSKLDQCYGIYYYDQENNITITKYDIKDGKYLKDVNINYIGGNYCSKDYVLSDMWIYEYNSLSSFLNGDILEQSMVGLIDKIYNSKRVDDPKISNYQSKYNISVNCDQNGVNYKLTFKDFSENELLVVKTVNNNLQMAVYEINDVLDFLGGLK